MGNTKSKVNIDVETLNKTVNDFITTNKTVTGASVQGKQTLDLSNSKYYCELDVSQSMKLDVKTIQQFENRDNLDLIDKVMTTLDDQMKQKLDEKDGFLSIPNNKKTYEDAKQSVKTDLQNKITNTNINQIITNLGGGQVVNSSNIIVDPCGKQLLDKPDISPVVAKIIADCMDKGNKCSFNQDMVITSASKQIGLNIFEALVDNKDVQNLQAKADQDVKVQSAGFDDFIKSIGDALSKIFAAIWLPVIIGVVLIFGLLIAWFISSGEKPSDVIKSGTSAATMVVAPEVGVSKYIV